MDRFLISSGANLAEVDGPVAVSGHEEGAGAGLQDAAGRHRVVAHLDNQALARLDFLDYR